VKYREIVRLVKADGWYLDCQKGSHQQFKHPVKPGKVTIPYHGSNDDLIKPIVQSILKQAGLK